MNAPADQVRNRFAELAAINVNAHTEKKGRLTYLSWTWAIDQLMRLDPDAEWHYPAPLTYGETMMVLCTVKAFGKHRTAQLPVMDHHNKAIKNPDAFAVNTAMQRCLVKAIALHGLGLYIYAGEDLPPTSETEEAPPELDTSTVLAFESAGSLADVATHWNALDRDIRANYRAVKDAALKRLAEAEIA